MTKQSRCGVGVMWLILMGACTPSEIIAREPDAGGADQIVDQLEARAECHGVATSDAPYDVATEICRQRSACTVCLQRVDLGTNHLTWAAIEQTDCSCPAPVIVGAPDGGTDGGTDGPSCSGIATFDIPSEEVANTICALQSICHVCVQSVDGHNAPLAWSAVADPAECPCPTPDVRDGGTDR